MERVIGVLPESESRAVLPASMILAFQRMRQTWRMLCLVGLGMIAAVVVVCAAPLYAQVAMTAGLRAALTSNSQNTDIVVRGTAYGLAPGTVDQLTQSLNQEFQRNLGSYLLPEQFSLQTSPFNIIETGANGVPGVSGDQIEIVGVDVARAPAHLKFVQGRMPGPAFNGNTIEIALRSETAANLHWRTGTIVPVRVVRSQTEQGGQAFTVLNLKVVGVFTLLNDNDPFWHGESFLGESLDTNNFVAGAMASNTALISLLSQAPSGSHVIMASPSSLIWYYSLNPSRIQINDVNPILNAITTVQVENADNRLLNQGSALQNVVTYVPTSTFDLYRDRLPVAEFPATSLTLLVLGLALFFIVLMTGILVDRQVGALALLRSRGASGRQIFWAMAMQAVLLGLIALLIGPLLAIPLTRLLAQHMLAPADQGALNILTGNPLSIVPGVGSYALATVATLVLTMTLAIWGTANRDVLALRREAARSTHRPFWQRLNLDLFAVVIALASAGFSIYLTNSHALDTRLLLLFLSPLTLLEVLCLLLAALLLLLRWFPQILRAGAWLAGRLRGAASLIALAQMSRAPRQSLRMTLLLALATAFTIFTLIFNASQAQRIQDVADYQAGADFSGLVPVALITPQQMTKETRIYAHLPGVLSASLGYVKSVTAGGSSLSLPIDFKAVDTSTFAQTARWSPQDSTQPLASLMRQLAQARAAALRQGVVPAFVDANTWNELHLSPGANFTLNFSMVGAVDLVNLKALGEIQHIPTPDNSSIPEVLADYLTFVGVYTHNFTTSSGFTVPLNYVWLRTGDDPAQLAALRHQLSQGDLSLSPLYDRRQIVAQLSSEPLSLALFGILLLGAITALLLALVGNLVASWLNARSRLANFAALRALGATPGQIASTLAWEQVIIYTPSILLGFFFGWLLSVLALPSLVFTSILPSQITGNVDSATFYAAQSTPPVLVVIPPALWIALGALIALCIVALGMMVRIVSRPSIAQVLRLNED